MNVYEIMSRCLSLGIIIFFSLAIFYGVKYLILSKYKNVADWFIIGQLLICLTWIIEFSYILIASTTTTSPIEVTSFGAVFIRPIILLTSAGTAVSLRMKYFLERCKSVKCQNQPKN